MCGLTGVINLENFNIVGEDVIRDMTDQISHRGPDGLGFYIDEKVAFGHRRLKIIDLSEAGKQPMFDISGRYCIIFNGEIYNYLEIKETLLSKGYKFHSKTDTEVILNAFIEYGIDCLHQFIGMFAFVLYDINEGKIFLVRDRLGIKPLYYAFSQGKLLFASEVKSILRYPGFSSSYNIHAISSYLSYRYAVGENTLFSNIKALMPGNLIEVQGTKVHINQYYELPILKEDDREDHGEKYYVAKIREILQSAVGYRMICDVPFGAYLSGGLDSSIVVALMSQVAKHPIKTFTIGFEEDGYNEFAYAKMVADQYQTEHHQFNLSSHDYFDTMRKLIRFKDAPLGVPNEPALHIMSRELKKYITVVLSGEGADEIFGGYGRIFRSPYDYQRMTNIGHEEYNGDDRRTQDLKNNLFLKYRGKIFTTEIDHFLHNYQYIKWNDKTNFLSSNIIAALDSDNITNEFFYSNFSKLEGLSAHDKFMWIFEKIHLVGLLQRVDMTTMATSVEARVPFVDHRLVEFALSIPLKYKLKWKSLLHKASSEVLNSDQISEEYDMPKYILKKAFEKDLPYDVVWRKKMGFPVPVHQWFGDKFNDFARDMLLDDTAKGRGIYNVQFLGNALNDQEAFKNHSFGLKIWMLVNLELWFREYFSN